MLLKETIYQLPASQLVVEVQREMQSRGLLFYKRSQAFVTSNVRTRNAPQ